MSLLRLLSPCSSDITEFYNSNHKCSYKSVWAVKAMDLEPSELQVSQAKALPSEHFVTLCAQGKVQKCWLLS